MRIKVPDYYKDFSCKCGECRHSCCDGWGITVSDEEYFKLIGLDCSAELRRRLDCAFSLLSSGDAARYAQIKRNWLGRCPLQREDGLCALQKECGEDALPKICRLYPRNIVYCTMGEGACSNSCEETVELLMKKKDGLFAIDAESPYAQVIETADSQKLIQSRAFDVMRDRSLSLVKRIAYLGKVLPEIPEDHEKIPSEEELFGTLISLLSEMEKYSPAFEEYSVVKNGAFDAKLVRSSFDRAKEAFYKNFPDCDIWLENIMNNHLFYERFPYSPDGKSVFEMYARLCGVFVLTRFTVITYTENKPTEADFADCISGVFRCFEHSDAESVISAKLKKLGRLSYTFLSNMAERI